MTTQIPENRETSTPEIFYPTAAAVAQFSQTLAETPDAIGIQMAVTGGGCAGLQYDMKPCSEVPAGFLVQKAGDVTFYIHPVAAAYLKDTVIDYSKDLVDGGFKFKNPNAASTCGCGSSFGV
ncbi:MAG: iron-sulfur cluster assembly accessory protein [Vampirovibrionales bacterium]|nr:iron-sulfur cluster assembly accessory protein [Vampirovibrionales bacterium]